MGTTAPDINALKARMRDVWMAGDFGVIARFVAESEKEFVTRLPIEKDTRLLDVACGTGNTTIPAAQRGANVVGVDIAPNLLEQGRTWARKAGVEVDFREGDAEQLDFPDASFDIVISVFGAMFAPRPERVAAELLRVTRPGGMIAMGNWTPTGFVGSMFALNARYVPPPAGIPAPSLWGEEAVVRQRLGDGIKRFDFSRRIAQFRYPMSPREVVQVFITYFGPTKTAFARLDAQTQAAFAADLEKLWCTHNQATDGSTAIDAEYLEVQATRV